MIVVIPSNRVVRLDYLEPLIESGCRFIVVDDSEGSITIDHPQFEVYNWSDRKAVLGDLDPWFPRRNGASRDFGFLLAWRQSDPEEIIVALDDDCEVYHADFVSRVAEALSPGERPVARSGQRHMNALELYDDWPPGLFPRGFPYSARPGSARVQFSDPVESQAMFQLGMWKDVFDVNAIDKVTGPAYIHPDATLLHESVIVAPGELVSVCSMNMAFRREVTPAAYQLPMHVEVMPGWVVDRYGDIWGGWILKTLMDLAGDSMAVGEPMIRHLKEGDYMRNAWQEHVCHLVNDEFDELLGLSAAELAPDSYVNMVGALTDQFALRTPKASSLLRPYLEHLVPALRAWIAALEV